MIWVAIIVLIVSTALAVRMIEVRNEARQR
jgi:hypothetical protein